MIFVDVAGLAPGGLRALEAEGHKILVCNADGELFAVENKCPHIGTPLDAGRLRGFLLECPLHGGKLDVRDGSHVALPIRKPARTYPVRVVDGGIEIDLGRE
jgi:nitrite reductase/ring-hydroxylating ferredoxin subunit